MILTSVRSVAGFPSSGDCCTNLVAGITSSQAGSSSTTPSITGRSFTLKAIIEFWVDSYL